MTALFVLIALAVGLAVGVFMTKRNLVPQLAQARAQHEEMNAKWLELVLMLDESNQLPEGAAAKLRQLVEPPAEAQPELTRRPGRSADRRLAEIARIKAGLPSLDSLEDMRSEDVRLVLIARIKAKRPMLHSLKGLKSEDRRLIEVTCAKRGVKL